MAGAGFHSLAKFPAQIRNAVIAARGVLQADCHKKIVVLRIAIVKGLNLRAECYRSVGFVIGLSAGVGNPRCISELIAKQLFLLWQTAELESGS
jgi:hypothetical protein